MLKRIFDYSLAVPGLFIFSPLWLIFSLAIWLEDRGPIYYIQERVGKNGRLFKGIKFRSMIPNAEVGLGPVQAKENDPRVTKMGRFLRKTAMDELPQLLNIAKGDMSFVGPRALRPMEIESTDSSCAKTIFQIPGFKMRSSIRPGLTGVAQVFASRHLARQEKFKYDLWYVRNHNIGLDIMIILRSLTITLSRRWDTQAKKSSFFMPLILIAVIIFHLGKISAFAQEYKVVRGIIDIHSKISDGIYSQGKIAATAKEKRVKVLIFSESALRKWEYGLWPLRNIIKKTYQENSVLRMGIEKYLKKFTALQKQFPDLVLIPGLEASPFFYWEGSPFSRNFALVDYYKQFLIIGLNRDYQNIPIVGNRQFLYLSKNALFNLWPIILIIFGLRLLRKKAWGISFILVGFLFLINNLPFATSRFNVYQGYQGVKPYQDLIDYVNQRGGLIFWGHPELFSQKRYFGIEVCTLTHPEELLLTSGYAGFGLILKDKCEITEPGDVWDKLLLEYLGGKRKKPVWIIGTEHFTGESGGMDYVETIFFIREAKTKEVLDALREGRMYVRFNLGGEPVILNEFSAKNIGYGSIQIIIKGTQVPTAEPLKIELIRNGQVFKKFEEAKNEWMIAVEDKLSSQESKAYYRLRINSHSSMILSNPLFVEVKK